MYYYIFINNSVGKAFVCNGNISVRPKKGEKMKYAILGFGSRGDFYDGLFKQIENTQLAAVCDKRQSRLDLCKTRHNDENVRYFTDDKEFFAAGKLADLCVISTLDEQHADQAEAALKCGYDLLLEKPIACSEADCERIYRTATELNRKVTVCHVLRYAPFFAAIKHEIESGAYGKIQTITLTENVGWWHQAHSYVRGNWHNTKKTSPMIIAKCCHDLDLLNWFMGCDPSSVTSMGSLDYFTRKNAPENSGDNCYDCPVAKDCLYNCEFIYWDLQLKKGNSAWPVDVILFGKDPTHENLTAALKASPYCKCVFKNDNDAVDHQVVNVLYENDATAQLTMTAFSEKGGRDIYLHCEKGEIYGQMSDNIIHCTLFGKSSKQIDINKESDNNFGHGGGDIRMIHNIVDGYENRRTYDISTLSQSMSSHMLGFASERSRVNGGMPEKIKKLK